MTMNEFGEPRSAAEVIADLVKLVEGVKGLTWIRSVGKNLEELDRLIDELRTTPEVAQRLPIALVSRNEVQPGTTDRIAAVPYVDFRPENLLIAPQCERFRFRLVAGVIPEQAGGEFLPASCFTSAPAETMQEALRRMVANAWRSNRVGPGTYISLDAENQGKKAMRFEAVLWGRLA